MKPIVSIIIPVYNSEDTLKRCLDSVFNQTLKDIEVVLINDCSTDKSLDILKKYKNNYKNCVLINNEENCGPAKSRNKGLDVATGKYIGFVDSDDYISEEMYEIMSSYMSDTVDLVVCSRYRDTKTKTKEIINKQRTTNPKALSKVSNYTADKLFKKEIIDKFDIRFPEEYRYAEDFHFLTIYRCHAKKMKIIKDMLYHISYNHNSITNTYNHNIINIVAVLEDLMAFLKANDLYEEMKEEFMIVCCQYYSRRVSEFNNFSNFSLKRKYIKSLLNLMKENFDMEECKVYTEKYWKKKNMPKQLTNYSYMLEYICKQEMKIKIKNILKREKTN